MLYLSFSWLFQTIYCHSERVSWTFCQTKLFRDCPTDDGKLCPLALLFLLLIPHSHGSSTSPSSASWAFLPSLWHSGTSFPLLSTGRQEQECSWDLAWAVFAYHALYYCWGLCQGYHSGPDGLVLPQGCDGPHWSWLVCCSNSWALLSWKIWPMVPVSSDFPCPSGRHNLCPLLQGLQPSRIPLWLRGWLEWWFPSLSLPIWGMEEELPKYFKHNFLVDLRGKKFHCCRCPQVFVSRFEKSFK